MFFVSRCCIKCQNLVFLFSIPATSSTFELFDVSSKFFSAFPFSFRFVVYLFHLYRIKLILLFGRLVGWFSLVIGLAGNWLVGWNRRFGWLVGWLVGWFGWLVG